MSLFGFSGKSKEGKDIKGTVEASNKEQALKVLREREIIPISVEERGTSLLASLAQPLGRFQRVSFDQVVIFTRQLSTMLSAGLPLTQALTILQSQSRTAKFRALLKEASQVVEGGATLSKAFAAYPDVFDDLYINLLKAGESSGSLEKIFERLSEKLEQKREFRSKTKGAMIYPIVIFVGMFGVMLLMLLFVLPKMTSMYDSMNIELPLPTKILIGASDFLFQSWWILIIITGVALFFLGRFRKTRQGKYFFSRLSFKIPILGKINTQSDIVEFASTLGLLLSSGVPITDALEIVSGSVRNSIYRSAIKDSIEEVRKGVPLSTPISRSKYFPEIVPQMLVVGEETGKVDDILTKLAKYFELETNQVVKNLSTALEPLVLIMLGGMVGLMVLAVIMPVYKLTTAF